MTRNGKANRYLTMASGHFRGQDIALEVAAGQGSDRVAIWLGSLLGEALGEGVDPAERGVARGQTQKILKREPM